MTLLDEIAGAETRAPRTLRDEVRAHILSLCKIRRDSHLAAPDYGVEDPTYLFHSYPGGLDGWLRDLESSITTHEPRLKDLRVTAALGDELDFTLRIDIRGSLAGDSHERAQFTASVDASQHWSLR